MGCGCNYNKGTSMRKNNNNTSRSRSYGTTKIRSAITGSKSNDRSGLRAESEGVTIKGGGAIRGPR